MLVGSGSVSLQGGTLTGSGTIAGISGSTTVTNTGGTVKPGNSPGKLTLTGNYTQGSNGTLEIDLGGTTQGTTYDWFSVSGNAFLNGSLNVNLVNGFIPLLGSNYTFLTAGNVSGQFGSINSLNSGFAYDVLYTGNSAVLTVTQAVSNSTPEPGTTCLFLSAVVGLSLITVRKFRRTLRS